MSSPLPDRQSGFPKRITLDRCINCGWITTGAWMHGPCPVCNGERYEACEYVPALPKEADRPYAVIGQQEHVELMEARTKLQWFVDVLTDDGPPPTVSWVEEALGLVDDLLASVEGRRGS